MTLRMKTWTPALLLAILALSTARAAPFAYVSSEKDNALTVVDLATQAVQGTIATCKRPRHLLLTPDRARLMAVCGDSGAAELIDVVRTYLK